MRCVLSGTPDRLWGVLSVCGVPVKIWAFGVWLQGQRLELCCRWWCTSLATSQHSTGTRNLYNRGMCNGRVLVGCCRW